MTVTRPTISRPWGHLGTTTYNVNIAVEVRLYRARDRGQWHLVAHRTQSGLVSASLTENGHGISNSLSTLQSKAPFPGKAVPGWQDEVVAFAESGLYTIAEVR